MPTTPPNPLPPPFPRIVSPANDILLDDAGHRTIDLFSGNGAAFLGHAQPAIAHAIKQQLDQLWIVGGLESPILQKARDAIAAYFPGHHVAGLYSTGMEAAEFAMRIDRAHTR